MLFFTLRFLSSSSLWETSYGSREIDICTCREVDGQMQCTAMRSGGVTLMMTTCPTAAALRVSGDGFVTNINFTDNTFVEVILRRSTITCFEGWSHFLKADLLAINGMAYARIAVQTTTAKVLPT